MSGPIATKEETESGVNMKLSGGCQVEKKKEESSLTARQLINIFYF